MKIPRLITVQQASRISGIDAQVIRKYLKNDFIIHKKIDNQYLISFDDFEHFVYMASSDPKRKFAMYPYDAQTYYDITQIVLARK